MTESGKKPLLLIIMDGWGCGTDEEGNAICTASVPNYDKLWEDYPRTTLKASGEAVGLPEGQMGNSEVGHLNIGAGRVVYQELTRISKAIAEGRLRENQVLVEGMQKAKKEKRSLHLLGLLSDGGVHSHIRHLFALLELAKELELEQVFVHPILDGRDVLPQSAKEFLTQLEEKMTELGVGRIATVSGRFYTMDRDNRWERVETAYKALVLGEGIQAPNAFAALEKSYDVRVTDEFVVPTVIADESGEPIGRIKDEDTVLFFNFRSDRARQISHAFVDEEFNAFERQQKPNINYICMTEYDATLDAPVAFPPQNLENTLGEVLVRHNISQLRIAETEKYAHVTFFFNGGIEDPGPGEDRCLIPSPKVKTYNLKPEMSAQEVTEELLRRLEDNPYDVIILNYANADMVGHTGELEATRKAVEAVDRGLEKLIPAIKQLGGTTIITSDHGNAEAKVDLETGLPLTAHTTNEVPFILVDDRFKGKTLRSDGALSDVAPTLLELLGIPIPSEMTGKSLLSED